MKHGSLKCDHYIPVSKGGGRRGANLVTACRKYNRLKSNKDSDVFLKELQNA